MAPLVRAFGRSLQHLNASLIKVSRVPLVLRHVQRNHRQQRLLANEQHRCIWQTSSFKSEITMLV